MSTVGRTVAALLFLCGLLPPNSALSAPVVHRITFSADRIIDTPFGLTSLPSPITGTLVVDDSILKVGATDLFDELPGFSLLAPIVIGDATFNNDGLQVAPGGRVVDGALVEVYLHAVYLDPLEGQRELTTYFFPGFDWTGTDFNPTPPSEFVFGTYIVTRVPEPTAAITPSLVCAALIGGRRGRGSAKQTC